MATPLPVVNNPKKRRRRPEDFVAPLVLLAFAACWYIGSMRSEPGLTAFFERAWPDASDMVRLRDDVYRADSAEGETVGYVGIGTASGYGGPLQVAVAVDPEGRALSLAVIAHRETPSFVTKVRDERFLERLAGKTHADEIVVGVDVDAVTGATYTSLGLTQSVHRVVREIAQNELNLPVPADDRAIKFGAAEIVLIALVVLTIATHRIKKRGVTRTLRWVTLIGGLVFLGFVYNSPFVLAHVNMILVGYWPEWQTHLFWYILVLFILLAKTTKGWNSYCYHLCPFGCAQELIGKVGGAKPRPVRWPKLLLWLQRLLVIGAICLALLFRNPSFSSFEIFGTFFDLSGSDFQFVLLAIMLLMSLFVYKPWCRYLCPLHVNAVEGLFNRCRRKVKSTWQRVRPSPKTAT